MKLLFGIIVALAIEILSYIYTRGNIRFPINKDELGKRILLLYCLILAFLSFIGRRPRNKSPKIHLDLFWSYRKSLSFDEKGLHIDIPWLFEQIVLNYVIYMPLGCLLPIAWPRVFYNCRCLHGAILTALAAALCSTTIEVLQVVFNVGICEVDDVFGNVIGATTGYVFYRLITKSHSNSNITI